MPLEPGSLLVGKYRIESVIGQGAYGCVYRARDIELERTVAIKELSKGEGEVGSTVFADYTDRFRREARVQARFNHPCIVQVHELLPADSDALYLVMECMEGGSLRQRLDERPRMKVGEALRLMSDLLSALERVHGDPRAIVHRDIKPANILLTRDGRAKLGDFGLAQVGDESMRTQSGKPHPGTPAYMSPEQETTSAYLYPASDIFSAGCVLFEMLSGMGYKQARFQKETLSDLRPTTQLWLVEILNDMLAQDPEKRAHDARELRERLRQCLRDQKRQKEEAQCKAAEQAEAEEKARREAEEKRHQTAEAETQRRAAEKAAAIKKALYEAEERQRQVAEAEMQRKVAEQAESKGRARRSAEEKQRQEAEAEARRQAEYATFVHIPERKFWIGKYLVTNELYKRFLDAPDFAEHELWVDFPKIGGLQGNQKLGDWGDTGWKWLQKKLAKDDRVLYPRYWSDDKFGMMRHNLPVVGVNWYEANAYCKWLQKHWGGLFEGWQNPTLRPVLVRLPAEGEWIFAAGGLQPDGRYPWDAPGRVTTDVREIVRRANVDESKIGHTTPVGMYPQGASLPYGLFDLAGNVWEWQANHRDKDRDVLALRGGSWGYPLDSAHVSGRSSAFPYFNWDLNGFRVLALPG